MPGKTSLSVFSKGLFNSAITLPDTTSVPLSVICSTPSEAVEVSVANFPEFRAGVDGAMELSEVSTTSSLEPTMAPEKWI